MSVKSSEILREAKKHLWDGVEYPAAGKYGVICFAIDLAASWIGGLDARRKAVELKVYIKGCLKDNGKECGSLYVWLMNVARIPERKLTHKNVQAHRHAWVDILIKEYEAKGD